MFYLQPLMEKENRFILSHIRHTQELCCLVWLPVQELGCQEELRFAVPFAFGEYVLVPVVNRQALSVISRPKHFLGDSPLRVKKRNIVYTLLS